MIVLNRLHDGKRFALTMSYDDGNVADRRLVGIFRKHGIKATFHLNSGRMTGNDWCIGFDEARTLYEGFDVTCHGVRHESMTLLPATSVIEEIFEDRKLLEPVAGRPIIGMSYANGRADAQSVAALRACGIRYSRTTAATRGFDFPEDYMYWNPTCHHRDCLALADAFRSAMDGYFPGPRLFYVWGHSFEFDRNNDWSIIERFCETMSGDERVWYASNTELYEYMTAARALVPFADGKGVFNPTSYRIWFTCDGAEASVGPGETWRA